MRQGIIVVLSLSSLEYSQGSHSRWLIIGSKLPQNNSYPPFSTTLHIAWFTGLSDNIVMVFAHHWPNKSGSDIPPHVLTVLGHSVWVQHLSRSDQWPAISFLGGMSQRKLRLKIRFNPKLKFCHIFSPLQNTKKYNFEDVFFHYPQGKKSHTGLEQHDVTLMMTVSGYPVKILYCRSELCF